MVAKHLQFSIRRCNRHERHGKRPCKPDHEIDEYIKDIQVDSWVIQQRIDFSMYDIKPIKTGMQLLDTHVLNNDYTAENVMTIRKHSIITEDDLLQLGQITRDDTFY